MIWQNIFSVMVFVFPHCGTATCKCILCVMAYNLFVDADRNGTIFLFREITKYINRVESFVIRTKKFGQNCAPFFYKIPKEMLGDNHHLSKLFLRKKIRRINLWFLWKMKKLAFVWKEKSNLWFSRKFHSQIFFASPELGRQKLIIDQSRVLPKEFYHTVRKFRYFSAAQILRKFNFGHY